MPGILNSDLLVVVTLVVAAVFVIARVIVIPDFMFIFKPGATIAKDFNFTQSWASNLSLISAFLGVLLQKIGGQSNELTGVSFLFAMILAMATLVYATGRSTVRFLLIADWLALWSVLGATVALGITILGVAWFSFLSRWLAMAIVAASILLVGVYAWLTMGVLLEQSKATNPQAQSEKRTLKWSLL